MSFTISRVLALLVHFDFVNSSQGIIEHMTQQRSVVVVDVDAQELWALTAILRSAGHRVSPAADFKEAKHLLATEPPDLLITTVRLGSYNGLHLILRSRIDHPAMASIVLSHSADAGLEAEALRQHARFLVLPVSEQELLDAVERALPASYTTTPAAVDPEIAAAKELR